MTMDKSELREIRNSIRYTQRGMAILYGVSERAYRSWEKTSVPGYASRFARLLTYPQVLSLLEEMVKNELLALVNPKRRKRKSLMHPWSKENEKG